MKRIWLPFFIFLSLSLHVRAVEDEQTADTTELNELLAQLNEINELNASLSYKEGKIELNDGLAYLDLSSKFRFLDREDARKVLEDIWGNPPDESVIGMIFPANVGPLSDSFTYAIEISYSEDGHVKDNDAKDIDYSELLEQMQEEARGENEMRSEQGYPTVELVGWASPPFYDDKEKKLHWAKELAFEGEESHTLNYNIRVLGRKGYLNLNIIGNLDALPLVKEDIDEILASVHFSEGNRYADFNPKYDKIAAYGIGGLIAGKVLAKVGILAKVGGFFIKFLKPLMIGVVALIAAFRRRLFGAKTE
ncbi:MAG: DUF2167 domain-containing protein [Flavobacteriales bacterium]|nr:DUF2167 domain-containing protein [Flavobacteriales bacterium]